jgi:uncharacterized membrane protein required for colicin V production
MKPSPSFDFSLNSFDLCVLAMLVIGVIVGRRRGMSLELLSVLQWLLIVFVGAMGADVLGKMLADVSGISPLITYITAYLLTAIVIKLIFVMIKRMAGEKLVSGEMFGSFEYYLGMFAGMIRFACMVIFFLALMNAKRVTKAELEAQLKYQQDWAGSVYFPPFGSVQKWVFEESLAGRTVKQYLSAQLINVDSAAGSGVSHEGIGRRREREVDEIMHPK